MIKNLIVPIDISALSEQSIKYVLLIERMLPGITITIVGCGNVDEIVNNKVQELLDNYKSSFSNQNNIKVITTSCKFHDEIGELANSVEDPLIIISSYKEVKNRDFFTIHDVIKIVDTSKQHIISLPENEFNFQLNKISYPVHLKTRVRHKATFTAKLAKLFGSEVDIVSTPTTNLNEKKKKMCTLYCQQISNHYRSINIPITINSASGNNLASVVSDYSKETGADIVSIIPEDNKDIRLFSVSYLEDLLSKCEVPTLIIAGRKVKYTGSFSASGG